MSVSSDLNLSFYKKVSRNGISYILDVSKAEPSSYPLFFITGLYDSEVEYLIEEITKIQNNEPYDPDFFEGSEVCSVHDVKLNMPNVEFGGMYPMPIGQFKSVLEEWLAFIREE